MSRIDAYTTSEVAITAGEVVGKPRFVTDRLEPQRNRLRGAAENRHRDRVRQADAGRAHLRRKELRLHHRVDRRVAGHNHPRRGNQQPGDERALRVLQRGQQRHRAQRPHHAEPDQQRLPADAIRERAVDRLQDQREQQRRRRHERRLVGRRGRPTASETSACRSCRCRTPSSRPSSSRRRRALRADICVSAATELVFRRDLSSTRRSRRSRAGCAASTAPSPPAARRRRTGCASPIRAAAPG